MLKAKTFVMFAMLLALGASSLPVGFAQDGIPDLIEKAAHNQDVSAGRRDRLHYEQSIKVEKFKPASGPGEAQRLEGTHETVVVVEPASAPDKTGQVPVNVKVVYDTDDNGKPKKNPKPDEFTLLSFGVLWDAVFFPLLPEKKNFYTYDEVVAKEPNTRKFRFTPKVNAPSNQVLAMGTVTVDAAKGEVLTIEVDGLKNLEALDKHLNGIRAIRSVTDYSQFSGTYRFPTYSKGLVESDVSHFKGNFHYTFEEAKYYQPSAGSK